MSDEDDGLLLNFSVSDNVAPKRSASKVVGGKWKDRRKLQLKLQGRGRRNKEAGSATGVNKSVIKDNKIKVNNEPSNASTSGGVKDNTKAPLRHDASSGPSSKRFKFAESRGATGGKGDSYVSSLFTSNDAAKQLVPTKESGGTSHEASNAPIDTNSFSGLGLNDKLVSHLTDHLRFKNPTKVQQLVIPNMISYERDLFIKAQTGSGKTLSFLLPIIHKLMLEKQNKINRDSGLFAIILTPTRELATQIYGVLETLVRCYHHIVPGIVIGGEKKKSEKARIRKGVNILVATPGRLADHMENTTSLDTSQLRWLILDEGDKLVELGFEETITKITDQISRSSKVMDKMYQWPGLPTKRVNLLCSATVQNNVQKLGSIILNNPEMITVDSKDASTIIDDSMDNIQTAPDQLTQNIVVIPPKLRLVTLSAMLKNVTNDIHEKSPNTRTIVFFSCSDSVDYHFDVYTREGKRLKKVKNEEIGKTEVVESNTEEEGEDTTGEMTAPLVGENTVVFKLHGGLSQPVRTATLSSFMKSNASHSILFCTDVAARGLDMPNISTVIEYDPPFTINDHLHRIGRSARVGKEGSATLFLLPGIEEGYVEGKLNVVHPKKGSLRIVPYDEILKKGFAQAEENAQPEKTTKVDPKKKEGKWDIYATTWHLDVERWLLEDSGMHDKAVRAFTSHIRAYATHLSSERIYFNVKTLHLGHLAKSFGLRETPKKLGKSVGGDESVAPKRKKEDSKSKMLRMARMAVKSSSSEFNY
jgi:ATP-dependent RNA helicase DDX31/DBP7